MQPFSIGGATVSIAATTTTGRIALGIKSTPPGSQVVVQAPSSNADTVFIAFGGSSITATTAGFPMLPGAIQVFSVGQGETYIAAICGSSTGTVYATPGHGE